MAAAMSESSLVHKVDSVLTRIDSSALLQQASSSAYSSSLYGIIGVSQSLREFKETLLSFKDTLLEVDHRTMLLNHRKIRSYYAMQEWMMKIKQVLDDAENMLDDIHSQSPWKSLRWLLIKAPHGNFLTKVAHFFSSSSSSFSSSSSHGTLLATQINDITHRLQHCASVYIDYSIEMSYGSDVYEEECGVVIGREFDKEIIIEKLLMMQQQKEHGEDDHNRVSLLPIVGEGGLGKSTLANIVLGDKRIRKSFSVRIWVPVSQAVNIEEVIIQIFNSICFLHTTAYSPIRKEGQLTKIQLLHRLENILVGKKFLFVLDDVRTESPLNWDELMNIIQIGVNGSKVLLTTRSHSIASKMGIIPPHNLQRLSLEDSLFLFEKLATKAKAYKYPDLIEVGREIMSRCEGVPLAIKLTGSMLFSERMMAEWESMRKNDFKDLPKHCGILSALRSSYGLMPLYLKKCFELLSLYPNDYVFHSSEVVSLWAALDLLPSPNINETLIDVSYQCLQKLIPRIFLKEFVNFGTSYYFQLHDLVLDLARDMTKYKCIMLHSNNQDIPRSIQHLSFVINDLFDKSFTEKYADLRTILFPTEGVGATSKLFLNTCLSRCRYLLILDLSDSTYEVLPSSIGKLSHLRFLSLERNEKIKRIPEYICKLQNLQVLNLVGRINLKILPKGLRNLSSLRQLGITTKESTLPENDIANLDSLEFLHIKSCGKLESFFVGIKLRFLKTLEVTNCENLRYLPLDIDHFPQLETLLVENCGYLELIKRHGDQNSNLQLKTIRLQFLPQLVNLPLWLQKSTNTLQSLLIVDCKNLEMLPEWLSTFNVLGSLGIVNCPKLMSFPIDMLCLESLGYLRIEDCPELCRKCQLHDGEYWPKISHIKQIFIGESEDLNKKEEE